MSDIKKMELPLISVIVPIYNVEKYVRKCLESLKNQTLRRIEIICIDDGSTDESGKIADEYESSEFPIFRVFHTENRGLSVARNRGIDEAQAEWLMFVDSDDWVDPKFCEIPHDTAVRENADLVIFMCHLTSQTGRIKRSKVVSTKKGIIDHETAIDIGGSSAWNKLYRKELFYNIRYPEGYVFEEIGTTHKLIYRAVRIYYLSEILYFYRFRRGSISHSLSNERDRLVMSMRRYNDLKKLGYPEHKAKAIVYGAALRCCGRAKGSVYVESTKILSSMERIPQNLSRKERWLMVLWHTNQGFYRWIYRVFLRLQTGEEL